MHHARIGGLLEHSVNCMRIARELAELYPVDRDLLVFGAIFHDVGKVRELSWDKGAFAYTTEGRLLGHVVLGERLVASYVADPARLSRRTAPEALSRPDLAPGRDGVRIARAPQNPRSPARPPRRQPRREGRHVRRDHDERGPRRLEPPREPARTRPLRPGTIT